MLRALVVECHFHFTSETLKQFTAVPFHLIGQKILSYTFKLTHSVVKIETHKRTEEPQNIVLEMVVSQMEITGETSKEEFTLIYVT